MDEQAASAPLFPPALKVEIKPRPRALTHMMVEIHQVCKYVCVPGHTQSRSLRLLRLLRRIDAIDQLRALGHRAPEGLQTLRQRHTGHPTDLCRVAARVHPHAIPSLAGLDGRGEGLLEDELRFVPPASELGDVEARARR
jgi:hypothetical protein